MASNVSLSKQKLLCIDWSLHRPQLEMETRTNLSFLSTLNLSSKTETRAKDDKEDSFKTGYALIIISVAIVIGNSFVLWTVKSFSRRLVADIFISCLALLDIIHTMTSIVLAIVFKWTFLQHNNEFAILCKIQAWFTVTTQTQSAFIVTLINLERLTAVSRPFFYKSYVNPRRAVKALIMLLFISICVSSLPLIAWGNYVLLPKMALCMFSHDSDYAILILVIGYADLLVVFYCFLAIKVSLKKFMERQARFAARRGAIVDLQERGVTLTKTASHSFTQSQRMVKVTAMVSGLFYFSWLPLMSKNDFIFAHLYRRCIAAIYLLLIQLMIMSIPSISGKSYPGARDFAEARTQLVLVAITRAQVTREPSHLLTLISSLQPLAGPLANPFIYFFTWERYKKSYIRIVKRLISCLANDGAIISKGSNAAILRSSASQLNQGEREDNKSAKKQTHKSANIAAETSLGQFNIQSINNDEVRIPTVGGKPRSFSYDSPMTCRRLTSQYTEAKRRFTFSTLSERITGGKEFLSEKNVQGEGHTRQKNEDNMKNIEEVSSNVMSTDKSQYEDSFSIGELDKKSRKDSKPWLSQKSSSKNLQKTIEECFKVNYGENMVDNDKISLRGTGSQLENYVPDSSVSGNEITERPHHLADKCLITQRINQYLTNVINDGELQKSQKGRKTSGKQHEYTKRKRNGSTSRKHNEYSTSKHQHRNSSSRRKPTQLHSRNRHKCSRKSYWEEYEDFRKKLDDDVVKCTKPDERHKETEKDHFHETFDRRETSDQFIVRILPQSHEYSSHGNKSPEISHRGYLNNSKKRNDVKKRSELNRVSKSKNTEASIWSYL